MTTVADQLTARPRLARARVLAVSTLVLLIITMLLPLAPRREHQAADVAAATAGLMTAGVTLWLMSRGSIRRRRPTPRSMLRPIGEMALYLSPVALLTLVFPIAARHLGNTHLGGVKLTTLLLASSVTVPWLSQAVCLPLYRAIGSLILDRDMDRIQGRLCQVGPWAFIQSLPLVAVFALPVALIMSWSAAALATHVTLCVLHVAFAQSLVACNVGRRRGRWAVAWTCYAGALLVAPAIWFLPPIAGLASQLVAMRRYLRHARRPELLAVPEVATDLVRGLLLGAVLWSDKFFLFLKTAGLFQVNAVFFGLLPAVLGYNYYFVRLAPHIDRAVGTVRTAMEKKTPRVLRRRSVIVSDVVTASVSRTAFAGALMALVVGVAATVYLPTALTLIAAVSMASLLFMLTTLMCYKLDYIGYRNVAQGFSAVHLVFCAIAFAALPMGATLYVWLLIMEAVLFLAVLYACLNQWRSAEYALFWRHATAW